MVKKSESFGLVTERRHYNARPIYVNCSSVRPVVFFIVECGTAHFLCARTCYSPPRLPLRQISFLSFSPLLACREKSDTQSLSHSPSLFDMSGTEAFTSEKSRSLISCTVTEMMILSHHLHPDLCQTRRCRYNLPAGEGRRRARGHW